MRGWIWDILALVGLAALLAGVGAYDYRLSLVLGGIVTMAIGLWGAQAWPHAGPNVPMVPSEKDSAEG